jgi:uncharacterized protein (TIGR02145 family)
MKKYLKIAVLVFLLSCTEIERDNPYDKHYVGNTSKEGSSSSVKVDYPSSPSVPSSSSLGGGYSGSYGSVIYEDQTYRTVVIGTQTWMAENLNYNPGTDNSACYSNQVSNCDKYGRLYDWATAMSLPPTCNYFYCSSQIQPKHRGICPSGWHIPSDDDWKVLLDYVGGSGTAGRYLKATSGWYNCGPSGSGSSYLCEDMYGFSALPGGYRFSDGRFRHVGDGGDWWSASEDYSGLTMYYYDENVGWLDDGKSPMLSVRCLQD